MKQQLLRREQFEQCAHSGRGRLLELLHLYDVRRPGKVRSERIAFEAISFGRRLSPLPKELFCSLNFDLLENPRSELELCQLSETSRPRSTLAIINDIEVDRKLKSYFATQELSSVKALYEYRLHACHSLCELDQLPRVDELDELLCEEQYDACLEFMSISHPRLLVALNANQPNSKTEFKELCNRVISRALTHYSLEERGFDPESLLLFSEQKKLRAKMF